MPVQRSGKSSRGTLQQRNSPELSPQGRHDKELTEEEEISRHPPIAVVKKILIPQSVYIHEFVFPRQSRNKFFIYRASCPTRLRDFRLFIEAGTHLKDEQKIWVTVKLNYEEIIDEPVRGGENSFGDGTIELQAGDVVELYFSTNVKLPVVVRRINIVFTQEV